MWEEKFFPDTDAPEKKNAINEISFGRAGEIRKRHSAV